ncbi:MAG TPA: ATP-grasp domain-containing protein [Candidatus Omnitrophota bacterium]|nr:ATP-grasp domain-containing protein [Candidatus Omnitrophota bacterium]
MGKKLKVLMLFSSPYNKPRGYDYREEFADPENMYTENDVYRALQANGYDVSILGLHNTVTPLFEEIKENRPDVIFNLVEVFDGKSYLEKNMAALLEMLEIPYTGATSDNIFICNNKALNKKILKFHKIKIPRFYTFYRKRRVWLSAKLKLPAIVKPLCEEASRGISLASIVDREEALLDRVKFIHQHMNMDAIAEEYIEGRELYVTVIGHKRLSVLPAREIKFGELAEDARIATYRAKWDDQYREKWGIKSVYAGKLANGVEEEIADVCKRAYRAMNIRSYLRFDIRVTSDGKVYIIEANANPCIAKIDEVAQSAMKAGMSYEQLIRKIVRLAVRKDA